MFAKGMFIKIQTIIAITAAGFITTATGSQAADIMDKLMAGHKCNVIFQVTTTDCIGTIARGDPGYTVIYSAPDGRWTATGHKCNDGEQTSVDPGGAPAGHWMAVWGRPMSFDDDGNVYDITMPAGTRGALIGNIACH